MSLIKGKQEFRTILDFSKGKVSKNMIRRELRNAEVHELTQLPNTNSFTFIENDIKVGMYLIRLSFSSMDADKSRNRLREYGGFRIALYEIREKSNKNINLNSKLFKHQYWVELNKDYNLRVKNLTDVIMYLKRLDNLKMFL